MKHLLSLFSIFLFLSSVGCIGAETDNNPPQKPDEEIVERTYTNPQRTTDGKEIRVADPFVFLHNGVYYLTGTTNLPDGQGFAYYTSTDLTKWEYKGALYSKPDDHIGTSAFWAPEVKFHKGKFYMTYSCYVPSTGLAMTCLSVSDKPEGPFKDAYTPWLDLDYSAIDANIFVDDDGVPYVYYSKNETIDNVETGGRIGTGQLYVAKLKQDLSGIDGDPVFISGASQPWEKVKWENNRCNEGPFVIKRDGIYYMTYSANDTGYEYYGVGVATAKHPLGPWIKEDDNPLMTTDLSKGISSPGHNSIVKDPDGHLCIVYHRHANVHSEMPNWDRVVCIDRLYFDEDDKLRVDFPDSAQ